MNRYYIHIPRTGGNTVARSLAGLDFVYLGHDLRSKEYVHPSMICTHEDFVFTVVRNPFDRLVSAYHYLRGGGLNSEDAFDAYLLGLKTHSFKDFILNVLPVSVKWQIHCIPQTYFINNLKNIIVLRYENIENEFLRLNSLLNSDKFRLKDKKFNASLRDTNLCRYFDDTTKEIAYNLYKSDFMEFNYSDEIL